MICRKVSEVGMADIKETIQGLYALKTYLASKAIEEHGPARESLIGMQKVIDSAVNLLKEQEPRVMTRVEIEQSEECIVWFEDDQFNCYALVDGIDQRNGWVWLSTAGNMGLQQRRDCENYGKKWRCWTKRPTEDQRKAVKWE